MEIKKNSEVNTKDEPWLLVLILLVAGFFRLWQASAFDIGSDGALYAFRALGWFDYLGGGQTTPIQWFGHIPGWAYLSFHDAPVLGFLIEKIFFFFFGDSAFVLRLPFALAGIGTTYLVYLTVRRFKDRFTATLASFLFAVSAYATWASLAGYLEGLEIFFITLSLYCLTSWAKTRKDKWLNYLALAVGASLIVKYTAIFLLPAFLVLIFLLKPVEIKKEKRVELFNWKRFCCPLVLFISVLSPAILYNLQVFRWRGHFDAALSSMVGLHPADFSGIASRGAGFDVFAGLRSIFNILVNYISWPLLIIFVGSIFIVIYLAIKKKETSLEKIMVVNLGFLLAMVAFSGIADRMLPIIVPLISIVSALGLVFLYKKINDKSKNLGYLAMGLVILVSAFEMFYSFNTNVLSKPIGQSRIFYAESRLYDLGWNSLDKYLRDELMPKHLTLNSPNKLEDMVLAGEDLTERNVIFIDDRASWFSGMWYIIKYPLLYRLPVFSSVLLFENGSDELLQQMKDNKIQKMFFVFVADERLMDSAKIKNEQLKEMATKLKDQLDKNKSLRKIINNAENKPAFFVYELS